MDPSDTLRLICICMFIEWRKAKQLRAFKMFCSIIFFFMSAAVRLNKHLEINISSWNLLCFCHYFSLSLSDFVCVCVLLSVVLLANIDLALHFCPFSVGRIIESGSFQVPLLSFDLLYMNA